MHPQLSDKKIVCREFIEALEKCHERSFLAKMIGACNVPKDELNSCLRKERLGRAERNRESSKIRTEKREKAMREFASESP
ncbi:hypothetical protein C8J56DRAFT_959025 [Mycena floridula]|nr:hypothetical protein C8J56DRAFT_959025 [Mycena floridula]